MNDAAISDALAEYFSGYRKRHYPHHMQTVDQKDYMTTPNKDEYNGWTNRETWLVPLWLESCPIEELPEPEVRTPFTLAEERLFSLTKALEEWFGDYQDDVFGHFRGPAKNSVFSNLLTGAIARINWREIAQHWVEDVKWTGKESEGAQ